MEVADTESEATYQELFRSLNGEGFQEWSWWSRMTTRGSRRPSPATSREHRGRRCQVHYARNLLGMVGYASRKELGADLKGHLRRAR